MISLVASQLLTLDQLSLLKFFKTGRYTRIEKPEVYETATTIVVIESICGSTN